MDWRKEVGRRAGEGGWKDDFPLVHELPQSIELDCRKLELPIHPMFAVRLRVFVDWHTAQGRKVSMVPPEDARARAVFEAMGIGHGCGGREEDAVVPVTRIKEFLEVEEVANRTERILVDNLHDVSALGQATFMAVSELCGNAIEHGSNSLGGYVAVSRVQHPRRQMSPISESASPSTFGSSIRNGSMMAGRSRMRPRIT